MSTDIENFRLACVQKVIVPARRPYAYNAAQPFSGHESRAPVYHLLIWINNSLCCLKRLHNIPTQLNHKEQLIRSYTHSFQRYQAK